MPLQHALQKVFQSGTVRMFAYASQAFSIAHCTNSEDLPALLKKYYTARN